MKTNRLAAIIFLLFLVITVQASVEVLGSLKHAFKGKPGDVFKGEIKIQNNDNTDQEVRIYQTDFLYNLEETTFYDAPGSHKRSNAAWIKYSPQTVVLKAKETRLIQYEIVIPKVADINGTYWSILMIEGVVPIVPNQQTEMNIRTVTPYAIQMVTELENAGTGSLKFNEPTLIKDENKNLFLAVDLSNDGDHYISPEVTVEFFDAKGESVATFSAPKKGIYPGTSSRFKIDLKGLPSKKTYKAMIVAAGQGDDVFGLEYTLFF